MTPPPFFRSTALVTVGQGVCAGACARGPVRPAEACVIIFQAVKPGGSRCRVPDRNHLAAALEPGVSVFGLLGWWLSIMGRWRINHPVRHFSYIDSEPVPVGRVDADRQAERRAVFIEGCPTGFDYGDATIIRKLEERSFRLVW